MRNGLRAASLCLCLQASLGFSSAAAAADVAHWKDFSVALGGDFSASVAAGDNGWFNQTEYGESLMHLFAASATAEIRATDRFAILAEVRSDNLAQPNFYALYLRVRPWRQRAVDVQLGRIPPVFGTFARRLYAADNPLIGYPLAYQYLTTLRADAVPASADQMIAQRGSGWDVVYPVGSSYAGPGLPVVSGLRWDTGVEARLGDVSRGKIEGAVAVTQGTLSYPLTSDSNGGKQVSARVAFRPTFGTVLGVSGASGPYLSREVTSLVPGGPMSFRQRALGADAQWSRGYWVVQAESIYSQWDMPVIARPAISSPLRVLATFVEARYKIRPGLYSAVRVDHMGMSRITGFQGPETWDAPVTRVEGGFGFSPCHGVWLKATYQHDWRDGGFIRSQGVGALQATYGF